MTLRQIKLSALEVGDTYMTDPQDQWIYEIEWKDATKIESYDQRGGLHIRVNYEGVMVYVNVARIS